MRRLLAVLAIFGTTSVHAAPVLPGISVTEVSNAEGGSYTLTIIQPPPEDSSSWYVSAWGIINEDATDVYTGLFGWGAGLVDKGSWDSGIAFETEVPCCDPPLHRFSTGSGGIGQFDDVFGPGYSQAAVFWVADYFGDPGIVATSSNFNWVGGDGDSTAFTIISNLNSGENLACSIVVGGSPATTGCSSVVLPSVPLPAAVWLFSSALLGLGLAARRKHT